MLSPSRWSLALASLCAGAGLATPAFAHSVCGDRIFPATLAIDDPGVNDELALPTITWLPKNSDGMQEFDASFSWTKTIFTNLGLSFSDGPTWLHPGGYGWDTLDTELKYNFFCIPAHEFMGSVGFDVTWGGTGTASQAGSPNMYSPVLDVGKGMGDLPTSLNLLRPLAITAEVSSTTPGQAEWGGNQFAATFNWGFTLQYSLPYYNSHVGEIDNDFVKHLIPITEFAFSTPTANAAPGSWGTTGTIQPGVVYLADSWQIAIEAVIPVNGLSGHGIGVVGELHFFFDDIFPNTLGKPIFPASLPMFTGAK